MHIHNGAELRNFNPWMAQFVGKDFAALALLCHRKMGGGLKWNMMSKSFLSRNTCS